MYTFRKVNLETDLEDFNELMDDLVYHPVDQEKMKKIITRYNQRDDAYLLVVEENSTHKLIGSLLSILVEDYSEDLRPLCYIENVVVHHDYRKQGVGKAMFEYIHEWAKKHNVNYELLVSSNFRTGAHQFYQKIGFEEVKGYKNFFD